MSRWVRAMAMVAIAIVMVAAPAVAESPPGVSTPADNAVIPFNEQPITVSGESPLGMMIFIRTGATDLCNTTVAASDGTWTCPLPPFAPGAHEIDVLQGYGDSDLSDPTTVHFTIGPSAFSISTARFRSPRKVVARGTRDAAGSSGIGYTVQATVADPLAGGSVPMTCTTVDADRFICSHVFSDDLAPGTSTEVRIDELHEGTLVGSLSRTATVSTPPTEPPTDPGSGETPVLPTPPTSPTPPTPPPPPSVPTTPIGSPAHTPPPPGVAPTPPATAVAPPAPGDVVLAAPPVALPAEPKAPAPTADVVTAPPLTPAAPPDADVLRLLLLMVIAFALLAMIGPHGLAYASDPGRRQREPLAPDDKGGHAAGAGWFTNRSGPNVEDADAGNSTSMALAALSAGATRQEPDRGSGDGRRWGIAWGDKSPTWQFPGWKWVDKLSLHAPVATSRRLPLVARIGADATYLRAMFGSLWALFPAFGLVIGVIAGSSTDGVPIAPSIALTTTLLVLALLDATSGAVAVLGFTVVALVRGGLTADGLSLADGLRGLLGLAAVWFAIPLIAAAARPFRRLAQARHVYGWDRLGDAAIASLVGGWAVLGVVSGFSDLLGRPVAVAHHAGALAFVTIGVIIVRMLIEELVAVAYPARLRAVQYVEPFPEPAAMDRLRGILIRGALMGLFGSAVIGNCWQLWVGMALYVVPQLATLVENELPNLVALHRRLPRGIVEILVMLVVGVLLAHLIDSTYSDEPSRALRDGFLLLALPGFVLTTLGILGRSGPAPPWTWPRQLAGAVILIVTVLLALVLL